MHNAVYTIYSVWLGETYARHRVGVVEYARNTTTTIIKYQKNLKENKKKIGLNTDTKHQQQLTAIQHTQTISMHFNLFHHIFIRSP